jgi:hypothetical protein
MVMDAKLTSAASNVKYESAPSQKVSIHAPNVQK